GNAQLQMDTLDGYHAVQYERKLPSLEARKRRRHHLSHRSAAGKKKWGRPDVCYFSSANCTLTVGWSALLVPIKKIKKIPMCHTKVSQMWLFFNAKMQFLSVFCLLPSKVQARMTFSCYLQRVQKRLLAESRVKGIPAWADKDNDQMELVVRFLRRAASNLQQDVNVVLPSHQLPVQDRRRILSHQLGEFIQSYEKTNGKPSCCVQWSDCNRHLSLPLFFSESDLEEVLTFYTQKNKSATVFLGTKVRRVKKAFHEIHASKEPGKCETPKISSDTDSKATESQPAVCLSEGQLTGFGHAKIHPQVHSSQRCSGVPVTSDFPHINQQSCSISPSSLPRHRPPPLPPQPPSYAQSLAKSQFRQTETPGPVYTPHPTQLLWKIPSSTALSSSSGAASSITSALHIYSQKLSRPTSAGSSKLKSNFEGGFGELNSLTVQAQSNQQAFISALQKLADKQVARNTAGSSHINLLTRHVSSLATFLTKWSHLELGYVQIRMYSMLVKANCSNDMTQGVKWLLVNQGDCCFDSCLRSQTVQTIRQGIDRPPTIFLTVGCKGISCCCCGTQAVTIPVENIDTWPVKILLDQFELFFVTISISHHTLYKLVFCTKIAFL
uniref:Uncharacterized protein n=1 Tax=Hippocampus comes TaxID=109280 RepID=A0A3Q2Y186_HIPCM